MVHPICTEKSFVCKYQYGPKAKFGQWSICLAEPALPKLRTLPLMKKWVGF